MPAGSTAWTGRRRAALARAELEPCRGGRLSFVNLAFMGFGADVYGVGTLEFRSGILLADHSGVHLTTLHSGQGHFPADMAEDLGHSAGAHEIKRAGILAVCRRCGRHRGGRRHALAGEDLRRSTWRRPVCDGDAVCSL